MKKILCFILVFALLISSVTIAYAKQTGSKKQVENKKQTQQQEKTSKGKEYGKKQTFKLKGSSVIKNGKFKVPIKPITKGMGATVDYDKATGVLTVTKEATTIVINFTEKIVTVNGVADTDSGIFTAKNSKKTNVLLKYIADKLGVRITFSKDKITTQVPIEEEDETVPPTNDDSTVDSVSGSAITVNTTGSDEAA